MNVLKKRVRELIPGDRLVLRSRNGDQSWNEQVIAVVHAPTQGAVVVRTRRDGETITEQRLDPMLEVEVVE